jgi:hypothetical protein
VWGNWCSRYICLTHDFKLYPEVPIKFMGHGVAPIYAGMQCKAGVVRNQLGLCKLILPVHCSRISVSTSQKMVYLVIRIGRYDVPLQLLISKISKYLVLTEKKWKYCLLH